MHIIFKVGKKYVTRANKIVTCLYVDDDHVLMKHDLNGYKYLVYREDIEEGKAIGRIDECEPALVEFKEGQKVRNPTSKVHPDYQWTVKHVFKSLVYSKKIKPGDIWAISISDKKGQYSVTSLNGLKDFVIC